VRRAVAALALAAALALTACGGKVIDHQKAEAFIDQDLAGVDVAVTDVTCPAEIEIEAGADFECEVTIENGDRAVVQMRMVDQDGLVRPVSIESADQRNTAPGAGPTQPEADRAADAVPSESG